MLTKRAKRIESFLMVISHRPGHLSVAPGALLMGCQGGLDPAASANETKDLWRRWTPMSESPHVELLTLAMNSNQGLTDDQIISSNYWRLAQVIIRVSGGFFGSLSTPDVLEVARNFIAWASGDSVRSTGSGGSGLKDEVLVARAPGSWKYHVIDGHHRVAAAVVHDQGEIRVRQTWLSTGVPLDDD